MDIELHQTVEPADDDHRKLPRVMGVGRNAAYASVHRGDVETMRVGDLTAPLRRKLGIEVAE
jgi:hypothetical protein